jgi:hypothetical protein
MNTNRNDDFKTSSVFVRMNLTLYSSLTKKPEPILTNYTPLSDVNLCSIGLIVSYWHEYNVIFLFPISNIVDIFNT